MIFKLSYSICALAIIGISFWLLFVRKDMRRKTSKLFLAVLITELLATVFSIMSISIFSVTHNADMQILYILSGAFSVTHFYVALICAWYYLNFVGMAHKFTAVTHVIFYIPYILTCIVPLLIPATNHTLYYVGEDGLFVAGPFVRLAVIGSLIYFLVILWAAVRYRSRLSTEQNGALIFLITLSAVSSFLENLFLQGAQISLFFIAVGLFIVLLSVDNQNWVYNGTTNTYNRATFQRHTRACFDDHIQFDIVIVQMSRDVYFDTVSLHSDVFQSMMSQISNYLKGLRNRPSVYYCERGTFLIPVFRDSKWQPEALAETIQERFNKPWELVSEFGGEPVETRIPVRILKGHIPDEIESMQQLLGIVDIPYDAESDEAIIMDTHELELKEAQEQENLKITDNATGDNMGLPPDLVVMLDSFTAHISDLTPSERRIVLYYLNGYEISDIPDLDGITINTVRKHNKNIYRKLQISSREELMMYLDVLDRCNKLEPVEKILKEGTTDNAGPQKAAAGQKEAANN